MQHVNKEEDQRVPENQELDIQEERSDVFNHNELYFLGTIILCTEVKDSEFNDVTKAAIKCYYDTWQWVVLHTTDRFTWKSSFPANSRIFYLLKQLSGGTEGRVWLACTRRKKICAINMTYELERSSDSSKQALSKPVASFSSPDSSTNNGEFFSSSHYISSQDFARISSYRFRCIDSVPSNHLLYSPVR